MSTGIIANLVRVAVVEWPDRLNASGGRWRTLADAAIAAAPDLLVTNELPFGDWLAASPTFDRAMAQRCVDEHEAGRRALARLGIPWIVSSRPTWEGDRLANEAFLLEDGIVHGFHRKQYFPDEPGWYEAEWFATAARDFRPVAIGNILVGVLLCTEAMFNEHARAYGRAGATLIAIPRATGANTEQWHLAARMAALVSGCYVVSANRFSPVSGLGPSFGGEGFAYAPDGTLMGVTSPKRPVLTIDVEPSVVADARRAYPRYVPESS